MTGEIEARICAIACSEPPEGRSRWTMQMIADELIRLEIVECVADSTVCDVMKKTKLSRGLSKNGASPRQALAEFVATMEDVLDVFERPYDPLKSVVCIDETNKQLISETRIPCAPGQPEKVDAVYERNGVANIFLIFEPLADKLTL